MPHLVVNAVQKIYRSKLGGKAVEALRNVNFTAEKGEFVAIMGESGSGKTTLLNIIASLDKPTQGDVVISGNSLSRIKDSELARFRRERLGFVFQDFKLLETFSIRDNIYLPLVLAQRPVQEIKVKAESISQDLGILHLLDKYPFELSGGEKQRASIARALMSSPDLLLADEPTGQLDSKTSEEIMRIFSEFCKAGQTIVMVTHSAKSAAYATRVLFIRDGMVFSELYRGDKSLEQQMDEISELNLRAVNRSFSANSIA